MKLFLGLVSGLCLGLLCACKGGSAPEDDPIVEEEQTEYAADLENMDTKEEASQGEDGLSEEERAIYEAYLQAEYAGEEWLYAYCDFDGDGSMELYIRRKDSERNFGRVMKYIQGGLTSVESGEISEEYMEEYMEELPWSDVPWEASGEQEEMTHEGIYVYIDQNVENHEFWYPNEQAFLEQYGFANEKPFYEYVLPDGTQRLKFYYNEDTQLGCGIDYYERDPSDIMTSGACGFTFQGLTEEWSADGISVDYGRFETVGGDVLSGEESYEEIIEYDGASEQVSHYEMNGSVEEGEEPEILLWMDYQYYSNGNLKERFYYHNPRMFGTWYTTWQSYFDTWGRLEHEYIYITHGWLEYYYLYEGEGEMPAYCLKLDNNVGWFMPEFMKYQ